MTRQLDAPAEWNEDGSVRRTAADVMIAEARTGLPAEIAAQYAGIGVRAYRNWMADGRAVLARLVEEPDLFLEEPERRIAQFATDVMEAQAFWVRNANTVLERSMRSRTRRVEKVKTERQVDPTTGEESEVVVERSVTTTDEPVELSAVMWRLSKLAPSMYGPVTRVELSGLDGGAIEVDIGKKLDETLARIAEALSVEESTNGNGAEHGPVV